MMGSFLSLALCRCSGHGPFHFLSPVDSGPQESSQIVARGLGLGIPGPARPQPPGCPEGGQSPMVSCFSHEHSSEGCS